MLDSYFIIVRRIQAPYDWELVSSALTAGSADNLFEKWVTTPGIVEVRVDQCVRHQVIIETP